MIEFLMYEPLKYYIYQLFTFLAFCMERDIEMATDIEDVEYYTHFEDGEGTLCTSIERFAEDVVLTVLEKEGWKIEINHGALELPDEDYRETLEHTSYAELILELNGVSEDLECYELYRNVVSIFYDYVEKNYDELICNGFISVYIISKEGAELQELHQLASCLAPEEGAYRIWDNKLILVPFPIISCSDFYACDTITDALFSLIRVNEFKKCL